jgi:hypothetical protein
MSIREKFERIMMAITFAEAGEHDTAREILEDQKRLRKQNRSTLRPTAFERIMMAITFAEAGEHDTAREMLGDQKRLRKQNRSTLRPRARLELRAPSARR